MTRGTVKSWDMQGGLITPDDGSADVLLFWKALPEVIDLQDVTVGMVVEFEYEPPSPRRAANVRIVDPKGRTAS